MADGKRPSKRDREGVPGVDREGEYDDKDVPVTGDAPASTEIDREGSYADTDVPDHDVGGARRRREGEYSDKDVRDGEPGQEVEPEGSFEDKDQGRP